jgi:hypothetical protein
MFRFRTACLLGEGQRPGSIPAWASGLAGVSDLKRILAGKSAGQAVALEVARLDGLGQEIVARIDVVVSDWPQ